MKHPGKLILFIFIVWSTVLAGAIETDVGRLELLLKEKTSDLQQYAVKYQALTKQANTLAPKISNLKKKKELNFFQRRQLEDFLKSSQELALQIEKLSREIIKLRSELQNTSERLVKIYDQQINETLKANELKELTQQEKRKLLKQLARTKQKRNNVQTQMDWEIVESLNFNQIEIHDNDSPRKIQAKADWLKDMENRLRTNATKIDRVVFNLKEEIELRDKMQEFEQELSLFNHRDEARAVPLATVETPTDVYGEREGGEPEITNKGTNFSTNTSILPLSPQLIRETDVANLSNTDIQTFIDSLNQRKIEMLVTADSLNKKAVDFYQKANQAKELKHQEKK